MNTLVSRLPAEKWAVATLIGVAGVFAAYVLIYLYPLGVRPLLSPDEVRYAEIPREMLASGDWLVPHLNGLRYFEKPPLGYWANALSLSLLGEHAFAVRLPGVLAVALSAIGLYLLTWQLGRKRETALLSAAVYLTFLAVYVIGSISVLDNVLALMLCAGFVLFYCSMRITARSGHRLAFLAGAAFGAAFLTKGFLAFILPVLVIMPWLVLGGRVRHALPRVGFALTGALLVVLPWSVMIHLAEDDFWRYFIWEEHLRRFAADDAQHSQPFYYYLMLLPGLAFPWLMLAPAVIAGLRERLQVDASRDALRYLTLWMVIPFVFFSLSKGKLTTYVLPCFAPAAVLIALGLESYLGRVRIGWFKIGVLLNALTFLGLLVILVVVQHGESPLFEHYEFARVALLLGALMVGVIMSGLGYVLKDRFARRWCAVASIVPLLLAAQHVIPEDFLKRKAPGLLLEPYTGFVTDQTVVVSDSGVIRALGWYWKRDDAFLIAGGELTYGLSFDDSKSRFLNPERFRKLLAQTTGDLILVCKRRCPERFSRYLPAPVTRLQTGDYVLWHVHR